MAVQRTDWAEDFVARFLALPLAADTILLRPQRLDKNEHATRTNPLLN